MHNRYVLGLVMLGRMALAQDPDEVSEGLAKAKTIDRCVAVYRPAKKAFPTAYIRGISTEAADCTRRVMNVELDRVLLPLKKTKAPAFKLGMDAQRAFNTAVTQYCGRWEAWYAECCSTCSLTEQPECEMDFHAARVALVQDALAKRAPSETKAPERPRTTAEFGAFAGQWCGFVSALGVPVDDRCATHVLGALETKQRDDGAEKKCR